MVVVAIYLHAWLDTIHAIRLNGVALGAVDVGADNAIARDEAKSIASIKLRAANEFEAAAVGGGYASHVLANGLGREERSDTGTLAREHIFATVT